MLKRLWVYLRKNLLALGQNMGRKELPRLNRGLLALCLLMLLPTLVCVAASVWRERKATQAAHILVPVQMQGEKDRTLDTVYWLKARLSEQDLARAYYLQANVLYLGSLQGRYRVYVDGDLLTWGASSESTHPATVSLPFSRLQEGQPLDVSIEMSQIDPSVKSDAVVGKSGKGFVTPEIADDLLQAHHWEAEIEPLMSATAFGILGALFFFGWLTQRRKQEYAYFAAFAFLQTGMHVCEVDFVQQMIGSHWMSLARLSFLLWEGSLAMLLGFALARTRASWMIVAVAITAFASCVPFASDLLSISIGNLASWQRYLFKVFVPLAYCRGAFACLIQWNVLSQRRVLASMEQIMGLRMSKRKRDLRRLGLGLLFVGALYAIQALFYSTTDGAMGLFRLSHFFILLVCYGAGVFEDRLRNQLQPVTQVSTLRTQDICKAG